ncbi:MAG: DNA/RNA nuclease SfsA [bacterium]|nr:DNA/RNA nuclease SfsA [bacterium]
MKIEQQIYFGTLIKRYKRFLADVVLDDGTELTVHCPNSGSMKGCAEPGYRVAVSDSENLKRKLRLTLEWVHNQKCWIGVNTHRSNDIVEEAIIQGRIKELTGYSNLRREVKYGIENKSRIDLLLEDTKKGFCYVEVKNVSLVSNSGSYQFPDAVTARGLKHINELLEMKNQGHRAVLIFVINRSDASIFEPAWDIDAKYAEALLNAVERGLEVLAYQVKIEPPCAVIEKQIATKLFR